MPSKPYTIGDIKQDLPLVPVIINGIECIGHVRGRKNKFATVYVLHKPYCEAEFSWDSIQRAFNTGIPLKF